MRVSRYRSAVSTLVEIQDAVARLRDDEKKALSLWLNSQAECELDSLAERRLLRSLDEAIRAVDAGKGVTTREARARVASWAAK